MDTGRQVQPGKLLRLRYVLCCTGRGGTPHARASNRAAPTGLFDDGEGAGEGRGGLAVPAPEAGAMDGDEANTLPSR